MGYCPVFLVLLELGEDATGLSLISEARASLLTPNIQRKQEFILLRGVDSEQHQSERLRHSPERFEDGRRFRRKFDRNSGDVQTRRRILHGHVQTQSFFALVYWRRYG